MPRLLHMYQTVTLVYGVLKISAMTKFIPQSLKTNMYFKEPYKTNMEIHG